MAKVTNLELNTKFTEFSTRFEEAMKTLTDLTESTNNKIDGITARRREDREIRRECSA